MPMMARWSVLPQAELKDFHARIQENWHGLLTTMEDTGVKVHDYFSIEEGLGRYEWFFQRTNVTLAIQQTFGLEFEVTRYPEQTTVAYNAASADSWAEIALVAKRLQTEEERVQEKEETKESVLKRLPR